MNIPPRICVSLLKDEAVKHIDQSFTRFEEGEGTQTKNFASQSLTTLLLQYFRKFLLHTPEPLPIPPPVAV